MTLHAAPVNKNLTILSPFNSNLVRTGTIADGSCFFHAVLTSIKPSYRVLSLDQKSKIVEKLRNDIADSITFEVWKNNYCNKSSFVTISQLFWSFYKMYYTFIIDNKTTNTTKHIQPIINSINKTNSKHIFEVVPLTLFQKITEDSYNTFEQNQRNDKNTTLQESFDQTIQIALKNKFLILEVHHGLKLGDTHIDYFIKHIQKLFKDLYALAEQKTYLLYIQTLKKCKKWITQDKLEVLSNYFKLDIYIFDDKNRLPYNIGGKELYKKQKSIILLYVNNNHFESIAICKNRKEFVRTFDFLHPFIQKIYKFLCDKKTFKSSYPELSKYLPTNS